MNYYNEIKNKLIDNEIYSKVKDYSKERHKVITYFEVGKLLDEAGSKYGDNILNDYSNRLVIEFGKKYNERTLRRIRQYYRIFKNEKWSPLATKLSWSHYSELLSIKDDNELIYYINIAYERNLSKRELREKIKNKEYQRMPIETKNKIVSKDKIEVKDLVPNPILIRNRNNTEIVTEKALHNLILEDIESESIVVTSSLIDSNMPLISTFESENIVLNPYNTSNNKNGYDDVHLDFFSFSVEQGQAKAKKLILEKYKKM